MKRLIFIIIIAIISACTPVAENNTDIPPSPSSVSIQATPSQEGQASGSTDDIEGDPGSGFGIDVLDETQSGEGFIAQTEGAVVISISGLGSINCENDVYVIRPSLRDFPQVSLVLPRNARPDNYSLLQNTGDASVASASLFLADGRVFAGGVEGLLIVNELANAPNQAVQGSFDFTANNGVSQVSVRGTFDFVSADDANYCS